MEDKKKKSKERFRFVFISLTVMFAFVYISGKTGYYESRLQKNTLLTSDAIRAFEKDLAEGNAVDIKDYIRADVTDYRNVYSKTGYNISKGIDSFVNEGIGKIVEFLKALFT